MAGNNWDSDDDDDFDSDDSAGKQQQTPKGLRAHVKKVEAENAEFRTKLAKFEAESRKATLADAIKAQGLNPKIAGLVPKDIETEALGAWLTEYGDVFGKAAPPTDERSEEDEQEFADMSRINAASGQGETPSKAGDLFGALSDKNLTQAKLLEMIEAAGGGYGHG